MSDAFVHRQKPLLIMYLLSKAVLDKKNTFCTQKDFKFWEYQNLKILTKGTRNRYFDICLSEYNGIFQKNTL